MARIRKFVAYRGLERPYTRKSKFRKHNFVRAVPNLIIARFDMGDPNGSFGVKLTLEAQEGLQIRQNALESARLTSNRVLESKIGKSNFYFKLQAYPFHVLRENPLASGAGADRMSTGMQKSFGKPIGIACQVYPGKKIFACYVSKKDVSFARFALKRASYKLPGKYKVVTTIL